MTTHGEKTKSRDTLRNVFKGIGNRTASWATVIAIYCFFTVILAPYVEGAAVATKFFITLGVISAALLIDYLFVQPWNGSRILKNIEKHFGPKTSAHVYKIFAGDWRAYKGFDVEQIARDYGEFPSESSKS